MKYTILIIISSILCKTYSFDMKYSIIKHKWLNTISSLVADDTIDNYSFGIHWNLRTTKETASLMSTDLKGGVSLTDTYTLAARFKISNIITSCLFAMERKGKQKLAVCFEPAGDDAVTITLESANIPDGKLRFGHKILKDKITELILSVTKTGVTQLIDCKVTEEKQFKTMISKSLHLTDDMDVSVAFPLIAGQNCNMEILDLDLYSPVDVTTLKSLCPNIHSSQYPDVIKGEKGDRGLNGDTGSKGEAGECKSEHQGVKRPKDDDSYRVRAANNERSESDSLVPQIASCPTTIICPAPTDEYEALKSIASGMKLLSEYIIEKTEQIKQLNEHITKYNERFANVEQSMNNMNNDIKAMKNAMLSESQQ